MLLLPFSAVTLKVSLKTNLLKEHQKELKGLPLGSLWAPFGSLWLPLSYRWPPFELPLARFNTVTLKVSLKTNLLKESRKRIQREPKGA